ncbi:MAG: sulfotransferase family protein [Phycisphaerales bacterium JB063]
MNDQGRTTTRTNGPPRFIVGMSRGGTTWMSRVMNMHPDVASFGETLFWGRRYRPTDDQGDWSRADLDALAAEMKDSLIGPSGDKPGSLSTKPEALLEAIATAVRRCEAPTKPSVAFNAICQAVLEAEGKTVAIEKTPHHLNWIARIENAMPGARFLIMRRDPYGFMLSYKHLGTRLSEETQRTFRALYHPIGCALIWRGYMRSIADACQRYPDQTMVVDMYQEPDEDELLLRVIQFFGLSPCELAGTVPRDNSSFVGDNRPTLSGAERFWINRIAHREIAQCGIKLEPASMRDVLAVIGSALYTPFWGIRVWLHMRRNTQGSTFAYLWRWVRR